MLRRVDGPCLLPAEKTRGRGPRLGRAWCRARWSCSARCSTVRKVVSCLVEKDDEKHALLFVPSGSRQTSTLSRCEMSCALRACEERACRAHLDEIPDDDFAVRLEHRERDEQDEGLCVVVRPEHLPQAEDVVERELALERDEDPPGRRLARAGAGVAGISNQGARTGSRRTGSARRFSLRERTEGRTAGVSAARKGGERGRRRRWTHPGAGRAPGP